VTEPPATVPATALHAGVASGRILRLTAPLSLWGGTAPDGTITDPHHPQHGEQLAGRVVLLTSGRGSSSSSSVLAELLRSGTGPAALVLAEPDGVLVVGALAAAELYDLQLPIALVTPALHEALPDRGSLTVGCDTETGHLGADASLAATADWRRVTEVAATDAGDVIDLATPELTDEERAMLAGEQGAGVALAMRLLVALARTSGARDLVPITQAHVDSCLYHGPASLDLPRRLLDGGARVRVPTTSNVGSVDLLHPDLVRGDPAQREAGRALMEAYAALGCRTTFTCAPYQDRAARPAFGEHVAWAESNAIAFVNSVVGARTARYGDITDIAAAITGRAPRSSFHLDAARRAALVLDVGRLPERLLGEDAVWGALGLVAGELAGSQVPAVVGAPTTVTEDQLKAFAAGAASSGGVGLFHVVGVTPEAPTLAAVVPPDTSVPEHHVTSATLREVHERLSPGPAAQVDAVSLGTPHASAEGLHALAGRLRDGPPVRDDVAVYVSTSRSVLEAAEATGDADVLRAAGVTIVVDTCTYVTTILSPHVRHVVTDSAKWAWYAPSNLGVTVTLATLDGCVAAARTGRAPGSLAALDAPEAPGSQRAAVSDVDG
jgi:predicted aconitase/predicted aconitase with swiveling domain